MRGRLSVAISVGVSVLALTVGAGTATAAKWAKTQSGAAQVCFTATGLDATAVAQAKLAVAEWNQVTTGLDVSYGNCSGKNTVPIKPQSTNGAGAAGAAGQASKELGLTNWYQDQFGNFQSATITFDVVEAKSWTQELDQQLGGDQYANVWRQLTCHEMGHALGLSHTTATDSCMQTYVPKPNLHAGAGDKAALIKLYGGQAKPVTSTSTSKSSGVVAQQSTTLKKQTTTAPKTTGTKTTTSKSTGAKVQMKVTKRPSASRTTSNLTISPDGWVTSP